MLQNLNIQNILFLDIETAPQQEAFEMVPQAMRDLWNKKASSLIRDDSETPESIYRKAGIYAEFGKVICISCGYLTADHKFRLKSFYGDDEKRCWPAFRTCCKNFFLLPTNCSARTMAKSLIFLSLPAA
jgi:hypothetical protein